MNRYITSVQVNDLLHLKNFSIDITDEQTPHLLITGKNGTGKTVLLSAIADFFDKIKDDTNLHFLNYRDNVKYWEERLEEAADGKKRLECRGNLEHYQKRVQETFGKVELALDDVPSLIDKYKKGEFLLAFYEAGRKEKMYEPKNPTKPEIRQKDKIRQSSTSQFLNFLSDLKIQEALARNEKQTAYADSIRKWFEDFESLLRHLFQDDNLCLEFVFHDYSFLIHTEGKSFKFTQLSDGYAAVIDIISDLILKMQIPGSLTRAYQKEGIVLIDEIETHLHLELQKIVLPMLTSIFPKIQFIITTHSPFVLNSSNLAVAYDLEHRRLINNLTEYSYEALAEGYFGVNTESSYMQMQLVRLRRLLEKGTLSMSEIKETRALMAEFESVEEMASPSIVGEYRQLLIDRIEVVRKVKSND